MKNTDKHEFVNAPEDTYDFAAYMSKWFSVSGDMDDFIYYSEDVQSCSNK